MEAEKRYVCKFKNKMFLLPFVVLILIKTCHACLSIVIYNGVAGMSTEFLKGMWL